jgi:hypothetical protein
MVVYVGGEHSRWLQAFENYRLEKFYNIWPLMVVHAAMNTLAYCKHLKIAYLKSFTTFRPWW